MEKIERNKRGITLVSLVITIIILLILAGITISQLIGSELFENSKLAQEKYENAQNYEEKQLAEYSNDIDGYVSGNRDYETEINKLKSRITELENLNNYSTTEKVIGKWLDGRPLYQKTFTGLNISTIYNTWADAVIIEDIKDLVNVTALHNYNSNAIIVIPCLEFEIAGDGKTIHFESNTNVNLRTVNIITVQYTKTTDKIPNAQ